MRMPLQSFDMLACHLSYRHTNRKDKSLAHRCTVTVYTPDEDGNLTLDRIIKPRAPRHEWIKKDRIR